MAEIDVDAEDASRDDPLQRLLLHRRIKSLSSGAWTSLLPALFSIFALLWTFWNDAPHLIILCWALAQIAQLCTFVVLDKQLDLDTATYKDMQAHWRRILILQSVGSTIWFVAFPYLAPYATGLEVAVLGIIGTAILCGTLLVHRNAPQAALFHTLTMSPSLVVSAFIVGQWGAWPTILLIGAFAVALVGEARAQERYFVSAAKTEIDRRESTATVGMLLNDYEEQSSEWLWTVGPHGNLRNVSDRFAQASGRQAGQLEGTPITRLFQTGEETEELARCVIERRPFRDILVSLRIGGEKRFWRLSARPRDDGWTSGVARDVTADRLIEERVAFMAHYDNLTGLANRYLFNERLRGLADRVSSEGSNIALFYLDLDDFKAINDTRGHLVGDRVLREVGTRLEQEVRNEDLVARLGGDEFAVLIETRAGDGLLIERAHRFLSVVRAPYEIEGHSYRISTSVGVARCSEGECDAEELMRRADLALYAAKEQGRDKLALFEPALDIAARERRRIESDLADALRKGQMHMQYQPVIDLDTSETTGFEALLRWHHPERGILAPGDFLHVAEDTGLISSLGEWVIRQSLADAAAMPGHLRIAINLSPTQVKNPNLVATVAQAIHATNIAPERVELEITEHVLMEDQEGGHTTLMRLRELGIRIALDDFGTGYSSLGYLRRFPFDRIKIDRSFVTDVVSDLGSQAIVSTITRLADALGMATTAEGIEEAGQLELLRKLGVQEAQGFLISRPVPPEELFDKKCDEGEVLLAADFESYRAKRQSASLSRGGKVG
ncbi:MAG: putative bifunctional diguanylate cyclase/phosphodiesterase [Qipengyuania vulgaris]